MHCIHRHKASLGTPDGTLLVLLSYSPGLCGSCFLRRILRDEPARSEGFRWLGWGVVVVARGLVWRAREVDGKEDGGTQGIPPRPAWAWRGGREIGRKGL